MSRKINLLILADIYSRPWHKVSLLGLPILNMIFTVWPEVLGGTQSEVRKCKITFTSNTWSNQQNQQKSTKNLDLSFFLKLARTYIKSCENTLCYITPCIKPVIVSSTMLTFFECFKAKPNVWWKKCDKVQLLLLLCLFIFYMADSSRCFFWKQSINKKVSKVATCFSPVTNNA